MDGSHSCPPCCWCTDRLMWSCSLGLALWLRWSFLSLRRPSPKAFTSIGKTKFIVWCLRCLNWGMPMRPRISGTASHVRFGPCPVPTLKKKNQPYTTLHLAGRWGNTTPSLTWLSQITLKAPVLARSLNLSSDKPVQYSDGWPFKQQLVLKATLRPVCYIYANLRKKRPPSLL